MEASPPKEVIHYPSWVSFPRNFTEAQMNLHIGRSSINFLTGRISDFLAVLGQPESTAKEYQTAEDEALLDRFFGGNLEVSYFHHAGSLREIRITSPDIALELGGKVGDTKTTILQLYRGGYSEDSNLKDYPGAVYRFLIPDDANPLVARGFNFYFGEAGQVAAIVLGYEGFAP